MRITIGLYLETESWRLGASLDSLRADLDAGAELLLLPDGPDADMRRALEGVPHLPSSPTETAQGMAAAFNRLIHHDESDLVVLLEAGCQVAPGWLEHLTAALASDSRNGLAGPSTCRAWNEQGAFRHAASSRSRPGQQELMRLADEAERRFGSETRTLEPLYSLSDFCFAVTREVIDAVGLADEAYGDGPCWEMDYNIRAARAGFRGVWAGASYVHRPPFTGRRRRQESRLLERNRRLYQDRFCGLRLAGRKSGFRSHCRGEACEHFAPRELIRLHLDRANETSKAESPQSANRQLPMVSCIMPTAGRPDFVVQSVRYFLRQDYPQRELIILDDAGGEDLALRLPDDDRVRYLRLPGRLSIGAKRNRGVAEARGEFVAHWDDDDWYAEDRLSSQIRPVLDGEADVTALTAGVFFDLDHWTFWRCSRALHRRMFVGDVHGGTLVYRRGTVGALRYPDRSLAEDAVFLRRAIASGARLLRIENEDRFVYLRHGANSWAFACGSFLDSSGWSQVSQPDLPADDLEFYMARSKAAHGSAVVKTSGRRSASRPLVSCIMPTADRREFVPLAVEYFLRQTYPRCELIVFDDGEQPVESSLIADPRIRYLRSGTRRKIGDKRNLACAEAQGEYIVHWDDDDWSRRDRLEIQVAALERENADVCGLDQVLFYAPFDRRAWRYGYHSGGRRRSRAWAYGATLCYRTSFWRRHPFPNVQVGEDNQFVRRCAPGRLLALEDQEFFIALVHAENTSTKRTRGSRWQPVPLDRVELILGEDLPLYRSPQEAFKG